VSGPTVRVDPAFIQRVSVAVIASARALTEAIGGIAPPRG
jgi:hypothetical protein